MSDGTRPVVVVGAGPAGMAAAIRLARHGAPVVVLDEQPEPGGQIYRGIERNAGGSASRLARLGADYARGLGLVRAFRASGVDYRPGSSVWLVSPEREVVYGRDGASTRIAAGAVVCATGAMERPAPLPGWTLPGVMTAGALQTLLKASGLVPAGRAVLVGSGPLILLLATQLLACGAPPAAIVDTSPGRAWTGVLRHLPSLAGSIPAGYLLKGLGMLRRLRAAGIPVYRQVSDIRVEGRLAVEAVSFRDPKGRYRLAASLVALHEGVVPNAQLTRALRCEHVWSPAQASLHPALDEWGGTSLDGYLVAGDAAGIGGAVAAGIRGELAALRVLERAGRIDRAARDRDAAGLRRHLAAHLAIRPLLDALYPPPGWIARPDHATLICRCEEVPAGELRAAIALGCQGPNQAKSFLRCGMGPCQGRFCGSTVSAMFAAETGRPVEAVGHFGIRPPIRPVTVGEIATLEAARP